MGAVMYQKAQLLFLQYHVSTDYVTIQIEPNYHKQPGCFATYLDEVPFYHYN